MSAIVFSAMVQTRTLFVDNQAFDWLSNRVYNGDQQTLANLTLTGQINSTDVFLGSINNRDYSIEEYVRLSKMM